MIGINSSNEITISFKDRFTNGQYVTYTYYADTAEEAVKEYLKPSFDDPEFDYHIDEVRPNPFLTLDNKDISTSLDEDIKEVKTNIQFDTDDQILIASCEAEIKTLTDNIQSYQNHPAFKNEDNSRHQAFITCVAKLQGELEAKKESLDILKDHCMGLTEYDNELLTRIKTADKEFNEASESFNTACNMLDAEIEKTVKPINDLSALSKNGCPYINVLANRITELEKSNTELAEIIKELSKPNSTKTFEKVFKNISDSTKNIRHSIVNALSEVKQAKEMEKQARQMVRKERLTAVKAVLTHAGTSSKEAATYVLSMPKSFGSVVAETVVSIFETAKNTYKKICDSSLKTINNIKKRLHEINVTMHKTKDVVMEAVTLGAWSKIKSQSSMINSYDDFAHNRDITPNIDGTYHFDEYFKNVSDKVWPDKSPIDKSIESVSKAGQNIADFAKNTVDKAKNFAEKSKQSIENTIQNICNKANLSAKICTEFIKLEACKTKAFTYEKLDDYFFKKAWKLGNKKAILTKASKDIHNEIENIAASISQADSTQIIPYKKQEFKDSVFAQKTNKMIQEYLPELSEDSKGIIEKNIEIAHPIRAALFNLKESIISTIKDVSANLELAHEKETDIKELKNAQKDIASIEDTLSKVEARQKSAIATMGQKESILENAKTKEKEHIDTLAELINQFKAPDITDTI